MVSKRKSEKMNLFQKQSIDAQGLFHLMDNGESLKIDEVKKIVAQ